MAFKKLPNAVIVKDDCTGAIAIDTGTKLHPLVIKQPEKKKEK